jgi:hypothetical protein
MSLEEARRGIYVYLLTKYPSIEMIRSPSSNLITEIELEITGCLASECTHTETLVLEYTESYDVLLEKESIVQILPTNGICK